MLENNYSILVAEPWDFESPDGKNIINGRMVSISNKCIVFESDHYLKRDNVEGNILVLRPRHYGTDFSDLDNRALAFNGGLLSKYNKELSEDELEKNSKFIIIGSFKRA